MLSRLSVRSSSVVALKNSSSSFLFGAKLQQRTYKTHEFAEDELNLSENNEHSLTRPLRTFRNEERKLYQDAKNLQSKTDKYKNAELNMDEEGKLFIQLAKQKEITFNEYMEQLQESGSTNYPWVLGLQVRQALHDVERGASASYTPLLKYRKEDLRVYQVAKKLKTIWEESDSEKPITYDDIESAFNLYKDHCANKRMMKSEYSLEYTKMLKALTKLVLVNRDYCSVAKQVLNNSTKKHKRNIAAIESDIESNLKEYESKQSTQNKILLAKLPSYSIQSVSNLVTILDTYENMIVECVKLMYPERCVIYDLDLCKELLLICRTSTASNLVEKRKELTDISHSHYDRETLFQNAVVICKESEQDYKIVSEPYELERPIL